MEFRECKTEEERHLCYQLRYRIYCKEEQWIDGSELSSEEEYDQYDNHSAFFIACEDNIPIGTARLILPSESGLPIQKIIDISTLCDSCRTVEVSRLAVLQKERNNHLIVFFGLTRELWKYAIRHKMETWAAVADKSLYHMLRRLRMPFIFEGKPLMYIGSESIPIIVDMKRTGAVLFSPSVNELFRRKEKREVINQ